MSDPIEIELYQKFINAKYDYISYIRQKQLPKFLEEVKDYVWYKDHWAYGVWHPDSPAGIIDDELDCKAGSDNANSDLKQLYYKLSKITHPDKCVELWAQQIFVIINEAYNKNNYEKLKEISDHWDKHNTFEFYLDDISKVEVIKSWTSECWYDWFNNPDSLLKQVLISPQEYEKHLQKECDRLKEENKRLKKIHDDLIKLTTKD